MSGYKVTATLRQNLESVLQLHQPREALALGVVKSQGGKSHSEIYCEVPTKSKEVWGGSANKKGPWG